MCMRTNNKVNWRLIGLVLFVFILALLPRTTSLGEFLARDERGQWQDNNEFFLALTRGDFGGTLLPFVLPGVTLMWLEAIAVWLKYGLLTLLGYHPVVESLLGLDCPFELLGEKQLVVGLSNTLLIVAIYLLGRKALGEKAALAGTILVALDPFLLTESRLVRPEALMSGFMALSVLLLILYLQKGRSLPRRQRWPILALSGAMAGLALLSKLTALFLVPFAALILLAHLSGERGVGWRARLLLFVEEMALWSAIVVLTFWALWPAMWVRPLEVLQVLYDIGFRFGVSGMERRGFFMGEAVIGDPGPLFYSAVLLFRTTPAQWLGGVGLLLALVAFLRGERRLSPRTMGAIVLSAQCLLFVLAIGKGEQKYERYVIPIFPSISLLAGLGLAYLGRALQKPGVLSRLAWPGLLALQLATALPHSPYYFTYYNPLLGGGKQAAMYIPIGSGEGIDQAVDCLNEKLGEQKATLACANSQKCEARFHGQTIQIENENLESWIRADYVLLYISQMQRNKHPAGMEKYLQRRGPDCLVTMHGLDYAWIYKGASAQHLGGSGLLEGRGTMLGYDLGVARSGETLPIKLYWRNEGRLPDDELYVRLVDAGGYEWARGVAEPLPDFVEAAQTEDSIVESRADLALPLGTPPGTYYLKIGFYSQGKRETIGEFTLPAGEGEVKVDKADPSLGDDRLPVAHRLEAGKVNEDVKLLGYDLAEEKDDALPLTLYWQALRDVKADYVLAVRLLDRQGQERKYWLGRPVWSGYPTNGWSAGEMVKDPWTLALEEVPAGEYSLQVELYDAETGASAGKITLGGTGVRE